MAITLPLPFRVAAGILGAGIDRVRALPEDIPALPVSLVGNAMRLSIKVQQEIAALATRGDELLGGVIGAPQEHPSWARFDDDDEPAAPPARPRNPSTGRTTASGPDRRADRDSRSGTADATAERATGADSNGGGRHLTTPESSSLPPETTTAMAAAVEVPEAVVEQALIAADDADQMLDEQQADAVIDEIVEVVATGADAEALAEISDDVAQAAVDEAAAEVEEALVEEAVLEEALIEETALEEAALQEAVLQEEEAEAAEEAAIEDAIDAAIEEAAEEAALEEAAEEALEQALEDAADRAALEETLVEVATEEQVLEEALVEAAVEEAVLTDQLDRVVAESAAVEAVLEAEIEETAAAEAVLAEALEEALDEEAEIEAVLTDGSAVAGVDQEAALGTAGDDADLPLPGYERLTLAQVRGHLRDLSADDVSVLLQFERDTENRPPFLTLLSNRLVTLDAQNS